jgi:hypothetical protein
VIIGQVLQMSDTWHGNRVCPPLPDISALPMLSPAFDDEIIELLTILQGRDRGQGCDAIDLSFALEETFFRAKSLRTTADLIAGGLYRRSESPMLKHRKRSLLHRGLVESHNMLPADYVFSFASRFSHHRRLSSRFPTIL